MRFDIEFSPSVIKMMVLRVSGSSYAFGRPENLLSTNPAVTNPSLILRNDGSSMAVAHFMPRKIDVPARGTKALIWFFSTVLFCDNGVMRS